MIGGQRQSVGRASVTKCRKGQTLNTTEAKVQLSSLCFVVEPSKSMFLVYNTIPQKEDRILLYIGYHSIPQENTTQLFSVWVRV